MTASTTPRILVAVREHQDVLLGEFDVLPHRVAPVLPQRRLALELRHLRVDEQQRPDRQIGGDDPLDELLEHGRARATNGGVSQSFEWLHPDGDLGDEAR